MKGYVRLEKETTDFCGLFLFLHLPEIIFMENPFEIIMERLNIIESKIDILIHKIKKVEQTKTSIITDTESRNILLEHVFKVDISR